MKILEMEGWGIKASLIASCPGVTNCTGEQKWAGIKSGLCKLIFSSKGDIQEMEL